jgi:hypothetical protein
LVDIDATLEYSPEDNREFPAFAYYVGNAYLLHVEAVDL